MDNSARYSIRDEIAIEDFPEGSLVLLCDRLSLVSLNAQARAVLGFLSEGQSLAQIADALAGQYDCPSACLEQDLAELLDDLERSGVVERHP